MLLAGEDEIAPGLGVGPVTRTSTEVSLLESLGKAVVKEAIEVGEGMTEPGLVIYRDDPARRLAVVWGSGKPAHPGTIFICYGEVDGVCRWRTGSGIGVGTTLQELERRNGRPFQMTGWGWDLGGTVVSWEGGNLEKELKGVGALVLYLAPRRKAQGEYLPKVTDEEIAAVQGDRSIRSNHPVLRKLNPHVAAMRLEFPR